MSALSLSLPLSLAFALMQHLGAFLQGERNKWGAWQATPEKLAKLCGGARTRDARLLYHSRLISAKSMDDAVQVLVSLESVLTLLQHQCNAPELQPMLSANGLRTPSSLKLLLLLLVCWSAGRAGVGAVTKPPRRMPAQVFDTTISLTQNITLTRTAFQEQYH